MTWYDVPGGFSYLKTKVGNASVQATRSTKVFKNGEIGETHGAMPMVVPFKVALNKFLENRSDKLTLMTQSDSNGAKIERKDIISILEYEISAKARELKYDY